MGGPGGAGIPTCLPAPQPGPSDATRTRTWTGPRAASTAFRTSSSIAPAIASAFSPTAPAAGSASTSSRTPGGSVARSASAAVSAAAPASATPFRAGVGATEAVDPVERGLHLAERARRLLHQRPRPLRVPTALGRGQVEEAARRHEEVVEVVADPTHDPRDRREAVRTAGGLGVGDAGEGVGDGASRGGPAR